MKKIIYIFTVASTACVAQIDESSPYQDTESVDESELSFPDFEGKFESKDGSGRLRYAAFYAGGEYNAEGKILYQTHASIFDPWSLWYDYNGPYPFFSKPAASNWGLNRFDVFVVGSPTSFWDGRTMLHSWRDGNGAVYMEDWGAPAGHTFPYGTPDATSGAYGRVDVFAIVQNTQTSVQTLAHKAWNNGTVYGWESYGAPPGGFVGTVREVAATSWSPGRQDIILRDNGTGKLWHAWSTTGAPQGNWEDWTSLLGGNSITGYLDMTTWAQGRLDIVAGKTAGGVLHVWYDQGVTGQETWSAGLPAGYPVRDVAITRAQSFPALHINARSTQYGYYLNYRMSWNASPGTFWAPPYAPTFGGTYGAEGSVTLTGPWLDPY